MSQCLNVHWAGKKWAKWIFLRSHVLAKYMKWFATWDLWRTIQCTHVHDCHLHYILYMYIFFWVWLYNNFCGVSSNATRHCTLNKINAYNQPPAAETGCISNSVVQIDNNSSSPFQPLRPLWCAPASFGHCYRPITWTMTPPSALHMSQLWHHSL